MVGILVVEKSDIRLQKGELKGIGFGDKLSPERRDKISKGIKKLLLEETEIEKRINDFRNIEVERGYISRLSEIWCITPAAVVKFLKKYDLYGE